MEDAIENSALIKELNNKERRWSYYELASIGARHFIVDAIGDKKVKIEHMMYDRNGTIILWKLKDDWYEYHHTAQIIDTRIL